MYLSIANTELCGELFDKAMKRLEDAEKAENEQFVKESVMDLIKALLPYQDEDRLNKIYSICLSTLKETKSRKDEKKAYRYSRLN